MKQEKKLKLYVWEDFGCDYTCGIAFAFASNVQEARKLIKEEIGVDDEIINVKPRKYEKPVAFAVYGGG